jgi:transcriptional regulator with XRE-family HTH domain
MLQSGQIRAARALLGWRQEDLAKASGIALATLARIEQGKGVVQGNVSTIVKIQQALEREGITFIAEPQGTVGVTLGLHRT